MNDEFNDVEIQAITLFKSGFDLLADDPRAQRRVIDYVANRFIEPLKDRLVELDAEIKVVAEHAAYAKYGQLQERLRIPAAVSEGGAE